MTHADRARLLPYTIVVAAIAVSSMGTRPQAAPQAADSLPNAYQVVTDHFKLPAGRTIGSTAAIDIDRDGRSVWVFERCGGQGQACVDSTLAPVLRFDASGALVKSFGAGM